MRTQIILLSCLLAASSIPAAALTIPKWRHISTVDGDLPLPGPAVQQTSEVVHDFDLDGINDFMIGMRLVGPSIVWYRRTLHGWARYVVEPEALHIEAGGAVCDIDGDGDPDLEFGGDGRSNQVWWWENPYPHFNPSVPWKRHLIKDTGAKGQHDQIFADIEGTGRPQLYFWNQGSKELMMAKIPPHPRQAKTWPYQPIFNCSKVKMDNKPEGIYVCDVDGDGRPDLLAGMWWFKYEGHDHFKAIRVGQEPGRIAAGRFKEGKVAQIVMAPGDVNGPMRIYTCNGNPEVSADWHGRDLLSRTMIHGHTLQVADINGDGHLDIFAAEMAQWGRRHGPVQNPKATAWIWYGDGHGHFTRTVFSVGYDFHMGVVADLNGDGLLDILDKPYTWKTPRLDIWLQVPGTGDKP